jgi:hypothetical protein
MALAASLGVLPCIIFAGMIAWLMLLPYVKLLLGIALVYIALKLLVPTDVKALQAEPASPMLVENNPGMAALKAAPVTPSLADKVTFLMRRDAYCPPVHEVIRRETHMSCAAKGLPSAAPAAPNSPVACKAKTSGLGLDIGYIPQRRTNQAFTTCVRPAYAISMLARIGQ